MIVFVLAGTFMFIPASSFFAATALALDNVTKQSNPAESLQISLDRLREEDAEVTGPHAPDTMFHPRMRATYDAALCLYHDQALFKEPGGGPTPWHQDQYYWPFDTDKTITMWMPLVEVGPVAGAARGLVDAVNVTDNATARVGMTPLAAAMLAAGEGLDPVLQLTCRDRNRLALTADLLGAHALGIRAVLCLSGDPMEVGHTGAKPVFDLDAVGLTRLATGLGDGVGPDGLRIAPPARFLVGVAEAPGADPSGGARFVQTQPVYDPAAFAAWLDLLAARGLPERVAILAGVLPPASAAQLQRFSTLPGWAVPNATLARMRAARDQRVEGIALAAGEPSLEARAAGATAGVAQAADLRGGEHDGLEAGAADAVDRRRARRVGKPRFQRRLASRRLAHAGLEHLAHQDLVDDGLPGVRPRDLGGALAGFVRLYADHRTAERDYYRRTRIFPGQHLIVEGLAAAFVIDQLLDAVADHVG